MIEVPLIEIGGLVEPHGVVQAGGLESRRSPADPMWLHRGAQKTHVRGIGQDHLMHVRVAADGILGAEPQLLHGLTGTRREIHPTADGTHLDGLRAVQPGPRLGRCVFQKLPLAFRVVPDVFPAWRVRHL